MRTGRPLFLITIDTEGDEAWSRKREITTRNSAFLPRFQELCERHRLRPTWLTNYEMATCPVFVEFAKNVVQRGVGEIGMHLHAWNSPPMVPLTGDDFVHHPYLTQFPESIMREKIVRMTGSLGDAFGVEVRSHRAGRWGFDERYARILEELGYRVDCSVTPGVSWSRDGGPDYRGYPRNAYFLNLDDIGTPGRSRLLELPVTIDPRGWRWLDPLRSLGRSHPWGGRVVDRFLPEVDWLRPNRRNAARLVALLERARGDRRAYVEFMLHSSELMPGGSPTFPDADSIERLYDGLEQLFARATASFEGATLAESYDRLRPDAR